MGASSGHNRVEQLLRKHGPMLSGKLAAMLVSENGITNAAARKAIERAKPNVIRLEGFTFRDNQKFLYVKSQQLGKTFRRKLYNALRMSSIEYWHVINAFFLNYGVVAKDDVATFTSSPVKLLKKHRRCEELVSSLEHVGIIKICEEDEQCYELSPETGYASSYQRYKAHQLARKILANDFLSWAQNINLSAYNMAVVLSKDAEYGKFQWSYKCPSYLKSVLSNGKPGFLIGDVFPNGPLTSKQIEYFTRKVAIVAASHQERPFIPFIVCDSVEPEAHRLLKSQGVLFACIREVFGNSYSVSLHALISIVENAMQLMQSHPEEFLKYLEQVSTVEGLLNNAMGDLFEYAVGYLFSRTSADVRIGRKIKDSRSGIRREIDVIAFRGNAIHFIECKGYRHPVDIDTVKEWVSSKVPVIRNWALSQDDYSTKQMVFEIWSTGGFTSDALLVLRKAASTTKKYQIEYVDKEGIIAYASEQGDDKLVTILSKYCYR